MINKKYAQPLFMILMSLYECYYEWRCCCCKYRYFRWFLSRWFYSLMFAYPIALIAAFTLAPLMRPLVNKIASKE